MKIATEQQLAEHRAATIRGGLEGTVAGALISAPVSYICQRRWPSYRQLPFSLKTLGAVLIVIPAIAIQAERRGVEYDRSQWQDDIGLRVLDQRQIKLEGKWEQMTTKDKMADWAVRHQYSLILGGWAVGIAVAGGIISRDRYQTFSQKIVQVRMWAQGLTIGLLLAAGALSSTQRREGRHSPEDHSWREVVEQYEKQHETERRAVVPTKA
ncbi:hypothetical protein C8J56DRAFT_935644 [Mycena floridula]|nr:hypothetical protein C8J56DRAFT_935644 [Mycena floridula]